MYNFTPEQDAEMAAAFDKTTAYIHDVTRDIVADNAAQKARADYDAQIKLATITTEETTTSLDNDISFQKPSRKWPLRAVDAGSFILNASFATVVATGMASIASPEIEGIVLKLIPQ